MTVAEVRQRAIVWAAVYETIGAWTEPGEEIAFTVEAADQAGGTDTADLSITVFGR